ELAEALRQSEGRVRGRMQKLERIRWQGKPVLYELRRESGLHAYAPSPRIIGIQQNPPSRQVPPQQPTYRTASREGVIAHSRARPAGPGGEEEEKTPRLNGWPWPARTIAETQDLLRQQALAQANAPPVPPETQTDQSSIITSNSMSTTPIKQTEA